jgi:hypothetical protein
MQIWSQKARHLNTTIQSGELTGPVQKSEPDFSSSPDRNGSIPVPEC